MSEKTLNSKFKPLCFSRRRHRKLSKIKKVMGCLSYDTVIKDGKPLEIKGYVYNYHNLFHYEISHLARIPIGKDQVSGIHGFYSPMFHDKSIEIEYDGILDEARVAIHEWLTRTSVFTTLKALNWMVWLASIGVNPIKVVVLHGKSLKNYQGNIPFEFDNQDQPNLYNLLQRLSFL